MSWIEICYIIERHFNHVADPTYCDKAWLLLMKLYYSFTVSDIIV